MAQVLFFKGAEPQVERPEEVDGATGFYRVLTQYFTEKKGLTLDMVSLHEGITIDDHIGEDTKYVMGYSAGTRVVLEQFDPSKYEAVRGVVVFDPIETLRDAWNSWQIDKQAHVTKMSFGRAFAEGFANSIFYKDNHYFDSSIKKVQKNLDRFLNV